ncbi:hypothetical protein Ancab_036356 [Ancistrocladus abbreviatus]
MGLTRKSRSFGKDDVLSSSSTKKQKRDSISGSKNTSFRSKIREMGPICKTRKNECVPRSIQEDEDVDFSKQLENEDECSWLSTGNTSPLLKYDEVRFISSIDGSSMNPPEEALVAHKEGREIWQEYVKEPDVVKPWMQKPIDNKLKSSMCLQNVESSQENSPTPFSNRTNFPSLFQNMEATHTHGSLINPNTEDSEWISNVESELEDLKSNFPSPTYEINWDPDVCSSGIYAAPPTNSAHESSHDELASWLLLIDSDEMDVDGPLFWPFDKNSDWSSMWDCFCQSPRKGICGLGNPKDEFTTTGSIGIKLNGKKKNFKGGWPKRYLLASSLGASKITEFKRGKNAVSRRIKNGHSTSSKSAEQFMRMVPLMMEYNVQEAKKNQINSMATNQRFLDEHEGIESSCGESSYEYYASNENSSTRCSSYSDFSLLGSTEKTGIYAASTVSSHWGSEYSSSGIFTASTIDSINEMSQDELSSDLLSESTSYFDEPLFWPFSERFDWSSMWDSFCQSPRKGSHDLGPPKDAFTSPSAVRLRLYSKNSNFKEGSKRRFLLVSSLSASKMTEFKRGSYKNTEARWVKDIHLRLGESAQRSMQVPPIIENDIEGATETGVNNAQTHAKFLEEDITENKKLSTEPAFVLHDFLKDESVNPFCKQSSRHHPVRYENSPKMTKFKRRSHKKDTARRKHMKFGTSAQQFMKVFPVIENDVEGATETEVNRSGTHGKFPEEHINANKELSTWALIGLDDSYGNEAVESSCGHSPCDYFLSYGSSLTPLSSYIDFSTLLSDLGKTDLWASLIDLEGEDSNWISDVDSQREDVNSTSPSTPLLDKSTHKHSQNGLITDFHSRSMDLDQMDSEEPLYWPFDRSSGWSLTWDCFCLSPRKERYNIGSPNSAFITSGSIQRRLDGKKANFSKGMNRRYVFVSSLNASKMIRFKRQSRKNASCRRIKAMSLSFGESAQHCKSMHNPIGKATVRDADQVYKHRRFLEEGLGMVKELPIETVVGLTEFDGHEGVDPEFNQNDFSLGEYLGG